MDGRAGYSGRTGDREEEGGSLGMGGQVTEAGQVGKCGTGLWNSLVVDGPAFVDNELPNYSTESIFINYSGIMDGFSFDAASFESIMEDNYKLRA